jgi:hypothetical protein
MKELSELSLSHLADFISQEWPKVYFGAVPYLNAMKQLDSVDDNYVNDSGRSVVAYFLANAQTWRGDSARAVKKELNRRIK